MAEVNWTTTTASNGSGASGANRAVALPSVNVKCPAIGVPPTPTMNEAGVIVATSFASVNVTRMSVPTATLTTPLAGTIAVTRGGIVSGDLVLNGDASAADRWLPAGSVIAVVASMVNVVFCCSGDAGTSVTLRSPSEKVNVSGTSVAPLVNRTDAGVMLDRSIGSEKRIVGATLVSMPVKPASGVTN